MVRDLMETRDQVVKRWERNGFLDPNCEFCREWFYPAEDLNRVHAPSHKAFVFGHRAHCSCAKCF
jgi:hypothetical protein